jgi:ParB/RepB/Spo0J family partition protein
MGEPNADLKRAKQLAEEKKRILPNGGLRTLSRQEMERYGPLGSEESSQKSSGDAPTPAQEKSEKREDQPAPLPKTSGDDGKEAELKLVAPPKRNPLLDHPDVNKLRSALDITRTEVMIPVDEIIPSDNNPRSDFDPEFIEGLGSSMEGGQQETVKVRPLSRTEQQRHPGKKYQLIAGEQRWRGAREKKRKELRCVVIDNVEDPRLYYLMSVLENTARKDISFLDEVRVCNRLRREYGMSTEQVATLLSFRNPLSVEKRFAVNDVPESVAEMLDPKKYPKRTLPIDAVYHLAGYKDDPKFQHAVAFEILEMEVPVNQCKSYIQRRAGALGKKSQRKERRGGGPSRARNVLNALRKNAKGTVDTLLSRYSWEQIRKAYATTQEREEAARALDVLADELKEIAEQLRKKDV